MEKRRIAGKREPEAARVCSNHLCLVSTQYHGCAPRLPWSTNGTLLIPSLSSFLNFKILFSSVWLFVQISVGRDSSKESSWEIDQNFFWTGSHPTFPSQWFTLSLSLSLSHNQIIFFKILNIYIYIYYFFFLCTDFFGMKKSESGNRLTEVGKIICK